MSHFIDHKKVKHFKKLDLCLAQAILKILLLSFHMVFISIYTVWVGHLNFNSSDNDFSVPLKEISEATTVNALQTLEGLQVQ